MPTAIAPAEGVVPALGTLAFDDPEGFNDFEMTDS
jgi:hypothetical protein